MCSSLDSGYFEGYRKLMESHFINCEFRAFRIDDVGKQTESMQYFDSWCL